MNSFFTKRMLEFNKCEPALTALDLQQSERYCLRSKVENDQTFYKTET
jgi:hypothetical protein